MPHTIRLRGPWEQEPLQDGRVRWTRRFHEPTGLSESSRVWLVFEDAGNQSEMSLHGRPLTSEHKQASRPEGHEITTLLQPLNTLTITIPVATVLPSARLEIDDGPNPEP